MEIRILAPGDALWSRASDYAAACPWLGGAELAKRMRANEFADWERVFLALDGESPAGFCALVSGDCPGGAPESPFIANLFVDRAHRGRRLSKDLIDAAEDFVSTAGAVRAGAVDARYDLAVQSLTLHWYDHRDALADQSVPSGFDRLLGQLRHREGAL